LRKDAEDVLVELRGIHLAAEDVGGSEGVAFELGHRQRHRGQSISLRCVQLEAIFSMCSTNSGFETRTDQSPC
jgi:hypothetical protein